MIRLGTMSPADLAALATLHAASFSESWNMAAFEELLRMPGAFALLAEDKGIAAGFVLIRTAGGEAEILSLAVLPSARREGIAARLVGTGAGHAARAGATRLFLEVSGQNHAARGLYRALGFGQVGSRPAYYRVPAGVSEDALVLSADLPLGGTRLGNAPKVD